MNTQLLTISLCLWLAAGAGISAGADEVSSADSAGTGQSVKDSIRELWRANVQALPGGVANSQIDKVMQKVQTIELIHKPKPVPAEVSVSPEVDPQETVSQTQPEEPRHGDITEQTLSRLKKAAPEAFDAPSELADALFTSGNFQAAEYFYQVNLKRDLPASDKAWNLLQIGNCLADAHPEQATKAYESLLADFPDSPWAPLAKIKLELIDWYQLNDPGAVLRSLEMVLKSGAKSQSPAVVKTGAPAPAANLAESR